MVQVLVIEDNLEIRENTAELLDLEGYKVLTAENGKHGYEMVLKWKPDVVLCDMMMPGSDGNAFLNWMKANTLTQATPIIFFTAGSPTADIREYLSKQGNDYLKKPFTQEALLKSVQKFVTVN